MVAPAHLHEVRWLAPQPMWGADPAATRGAAARPAILRFATDAFMEELIAVTATRPEQLPAWIARPESWREPMAAPDTAGLSPQEPFSVERARLTRIARGRTPPSGLPVLASPPDPLKLYQPAQGRFYLVAASLVCQLPGLPDRAVDGGKQEQVRFVIRRLVTPDEDTIPEPESPDTAEYAFVPEGQGFAWRPIEGLAARNQLQPNEERLPLFPLTYRAGRGKDPERRRRLLAGAIPVARREAYLGAPSTDAPGGGPEAPSDPRALLFQAEVVSPWLSLIDQAETAQRMIVEPTANMTAAEETRRADAARDLLRRFRERAQTASWFLLLDLATFLQDHMPRIWGALTGAPPSPPPSSAEAAVASALAGCAMSDALRDDLAADLPGWTVEPSLVAAMIRANAMAAALDAVERELVLTAPAGLHGWPTFLFLAAHPAVAIPDAPATNIVSSGQMAGPQPALPGDPAGAVAALTGLIAAALPATPTAPLPELNAPPQLVSGADGWFAIRCVYERPNCAGFAKPVVSRPSAPFRMASFFDPDAPARALRIPMPLDISPAALRKYKKGAGFVLSDLFCGQMQRFKSVTLGDLIRSVLPWPLHKDLPGGAATPCGSGSTAFGLFVSISIPIVTICAFILMIIMVTLFDLVFRWLPYLLVVFPIPGIKGKRP